uniref:Uncharacterized protein n=1 Tax=Caudovirales sp. ctqPn17 TaxID=2825772 RepID=A0A8S5QFN7_9CAUD|nr:MAG TPA: hypothetical protein [Caudovirales sp. ctqPn17]
MQIQRHFRHNPPDDGRVVTGRSGPCRTVAENRKKQGG